MYLAGHDILVVRLFPILMLGIDMLRIYAELTEDIMSMNFYKVVNKKLFHLFAYIAISNRTCLFVHRYVVRFDIF